MNVFSTRFHDCELTIHNLEGQRWFTGADIARALEYADAAKITSLYRRHADEFDPSMTCCFKLKQQGQMRSVRVFSKVGAQVLTMLSKSKRAAEFRRWVLHVFNEVTAASAELPAQPAPIAAEPPVSRIEPATVERAAPALPLSPPQPTIAVADYIALQARLIETQERLLAASGTRRRKAAVKPMTADEIAQMRHLRAAGLPCAEIARRLGRSSGAVSLLTRDVQASADLFGGAA